MRWSAAKERNPLFASPSPTPMRPSSTFLRTGTTVVIARHPSGAAARVASPATRPMLHSDELHRANGQTIEQALWRSLIDYEVAKVRRVPP